MSVTSNKFDKILSRLEGVKKTGIENWNGGNR